MQRTQSYRQADTMAMLPMLSHTTPSNAESAIDFHTGKKTATTGLSQYTARGHDLLETFLIAPSEGDVENQKKVDKLMSELFSIFCENYHKRCTKLQELINCETPSDEQFIQQISCGPIYKTDCIRFIRQYIEKFGNQSLFKETALSDLEQMANKSLPVTRLRDGKQFMKAVSYMKYVADENIPATEVLDAMLNQVSWIDCNIAYEIVFYLLIYIIVGATRFNHLFSKEGIGLITISINGMKGSPLWHVARSRPKDNKNEQQENPPENPQYGTVYYYKNHQDYLKKHPNGSFQGHNLILVDKELGEPTFTALGLSGKGLRTQEIEKQLIEQFNCDPFDDFHGDDMHGAADSEDIINMNKLRYKIISREDLHANGGGWIGGSTAYLHLKALLACLRQPEQPTPAPSITEVQEATPFNKQSVINAVACGFVGLAIGTFICIVFSDQLKQLETSDEDKFSPTVTILVVLTLIGACAGLFVKPLLERIRRKIRAHCIDCWGPAQSIASAVNSSALPIRARQIETTL
ncbi:hypothetical protein ElyMa_002732400 [Elysia marginata]|uniref:Uncharacterized protein n=1 Tax=Elysia marginata TaxID=1093978 RepID=A0AAV4HIF7_9GAST|nr:hypothetical protein ElyMa_002732400 [Elysia marginata]